MPDVPPPAGARRATSVFIFATVLLDVLALGVIIPILPKLIKSMMGDDTRAGALMYGHFGTVWALMQFFGSPFLGLLSDRFGRRPVILLSCFGLGLDYVFMAIAPTLAWLFVGRVISGFTAASFSTAGAYIADVTPPEKRAGAYGMMGAAWGIGFVVGPAMGGFLGSLAPRLPFWVAGALSLLNAGYGIFVLPESLPPERRSGFSWTKANPIGSLGLLRSNPRLLGLAACSFLNQLAHQVYPSLFVLYVGHRFGWGEGPVGLALTAVGVCNVLVQAGLVRTFVARFGERMALFVGLFFGSSGFLIYGLASSPRLFCAAIPVFCIMGLFGASLQGLMTRLVKPTQQGQLQGANGSLVGIAGLIGPSLYTGVYAQCLALGPKVLEGTPFLVSASLLALAFPVAFWATRGIAVPSGPAAPVEEGASLALKGGPESGPLAQESRE
jgi:DHA1 family tetracycline resistance protein-like MFS transporter